MVPTPASRVSLLAPARIVSRMAGGGAYESVAGRLAAAHSADIADVIDDCLRDLGECCAARCVALVRAGAAVRTVWLARETPAPTLLNEALQAFAAELTARASDVRAVTLNADSRSNGERKLASFSLRFVEILPLNTAGASEGVVLVCQTSRKLRDRIGGPAFGSRAELEAIARLIAIGVERGRLSDERRAIKRRLRQSQRLEIAGATAAGMAHNLNNVLAAMLGHTETALEASCGEPSVYNAIVSIKNAGERAGELIENVLGFGRRDVVEKIVKLGALGEETIEMIRPSIPVSVRLELRDRSEGALTMGREEEIQQVLFNLVRNAAQAIPGEGEVVLTLDVRRGDPSLGTQIGAMSARDYVVLEVRDTGIGIDPYMRDDVFRPFYTTRPAGTGLGLSTVADIVAEHAGALRVFDAPGGGTIFEVWLPASDPAQRGAFLPRGDGEPVLIVAERVVREKVEDIVAALGYEPLGLSRSREALHVIEADPESYRAVFLCTDLSELEEYFFLTERFRTVCPGLPLTILTSGRTPPTPLGGTSAQKAWIAGMDSLAAVASALRLMLGASEPGRDSASLS